MTTKPTPAHAGQLERILEIKMSFDHQSLASPAQRGAELSVDEAQPHSSPHPVVTHAGAQAPLVPCVYIALLCSHCGDLRQALAALPDSDITVCPECARACAFVLLGSGLTKRLLPFHEIRPAEPICWDRHSDETDENDATHHTEDDS